MHDATTEEPASGRRATRPVGESLAEASATLRAIRDAGPAIILVDGAGVVVLASAAADALWSRHPEGLRLTELFDDPIANDLDVAVREGSPWSGHLATDDDIRRTLECTSTPLALADAATTGAVSCVSLVDRTAELNRIADLEAANRRSLALLDAMPDLLFRISSDLTFLDYRDPTTRGIDVPPDQFLGKRLDAFLPPEIVELVEPNLLKTLASGQVVTYPSFYDYGDGRHTFDNRVVKSGPAEVVLICRDTTEQTRAEIELRRNQARFQRIVQFSREYTAITDSENIIRFISEPVERVLGYKPDELIGTSAMDLIHPDDLDAGSFASRRTLSGTGSIPPLRIRLRHKSGEWRFFETTAKSLFDDELVGGLLTHCRDITDYVDVENSLRKSVTKLDAILDTAADGIITFGVTGAIESINGAAQQMFGVPEEVALQKNITELLTPEGQSAVQHVLEEASLLDGDAFAPVTDDIDGIRGDGSSFPLNISVSHLRVDGTDLFTAIIRDMSERHALQRQLEYQATHDALTGLPNRSLFHANVERAMRQSSITGKSLSIIFMDLDRFKNVNDSLGHALGDQLLVAVANRLTGNLRGDGTVARFGGDEFLILCELEEQNDVYPIANRLLESLRRPFEVGTEEVFLGASAGIAMYDPRSGTDVGTLIRNADVALYRAKEKGRSRYEVFDASIHARSQQRLAIETALRHAIDRDELVTFFQPIFSLSANEYIGTEALVRWQHDGRLMAPGNFIDIAEESGLIVDIGAWILDDACATTHQWQQRPALTRLGVSVNVSGRQLDQPDFPQRVRESLDRTKINPSTVTLEITETTLIYDDPRTLRQLSALKELGVKIAIDDFGTGYSSIGYLRHLPIDTIKIDRSFISQLEHDHQTAAIVNTITNLAHTLSMNVVAEGVENGRQLEILRNAGCDWLQGYFFARPAAAEDIQAILLAHPYGNAYPPAALVLPAP